MIDDRPVRDVLAEMMRRERIGLTRPFWADWCRFDNDGGPEQWRLRADHLIRLLGDEGCTISRRGDANPPMPAPTSPVFCRFHMDGSDAERLLRMAGDKIEVVRVAGGEETVQIAFSLNDAHTAAGNLLLGDKETAKRPGIFTMLSAALEAYRLDVAVMEPAK
jgi:hypothetical protein